jgi:hypothetical protein
MWLLPITLRLSALAGMIKSFFIDEDSLFFISSIEEKYFAQEREKIIESPVAKRKRCAL